MEANKKNSTDQMQESLSYKKKDISSFLNKKTLEQFPQFQSNIFRYEKKSLKEIAKLELKGFVAYINIIGILFCLFLFSKNISDILQIAFAFGIIVILVVQVAFKSYQEDIIVSYIQELKSKIPTKVTVVRENKKTEEVPVEDLKNGDIIKLTNGDVVPVDVTILEKKDLEIDDSFIKNLYKELNQTKENDEILNSSNLLLQSSIIKKGNCKAVVLSGKDDMMIQLATFKFIQNEQNRLKIFRWIITIARIICARIVVIKFVFYYYGEEKIYNLFKGLRSEL